MEMYLKKYFWVLPVIVVIVCATLLAMAANHVIEAKYLLGDEATQKTKRPKKPVAPKAAVSKSGEPITARNMFCSDCQPPEPAAVVTTPTQPSDPNNPPPTSLPLALVGTFVASDDAFSSATIVNTATAKGGSYWREEEIPGAGPIVRIASRYVDFQNRTTNRVERIDIMGVPAAQPATTTTQPPVTTTSSRPGDNAEFLSALDKGIRKVDDNKYEIDRSLVDMVLGDPNLVSRSARIVPSIKDGKANGFKVYAIRPNSAFAKIGLQNGDTLHSVNGYEMTSPDKALEVYTKVKSANNLSISITRRGQPVTMDYSIK